MGRYPQRSWPAELHLLDKDLGALTRTWRWHLLHCRFGPAQDTMRQLDDGLDYRLTLKPQPKVG